MSDRYSSSRCMNTSGRSSDRFSASARITILTTRVSSSTVSSIAASRARPDPSSRTSSRWAWWWVRGYPSRTNPSASAGTRTASTTSSVTFLPCITRSLTPWGSPSSIERRRSHPVDTWGTPRCSASRRPWVPFPDAGGPSITIRSTGPVCRSRCRHRKVAGRWLLVPQSGQEPVDAGGGGGRGGVRRSVVRLRRGVHAVPIEFVQDAGWQESGQLRVVVGVVEPPRTPVVAEREVDVQGVAGPGQRDVEQASLLLDVVGVPGGHVRGDHAVGCVDEVDGVPLAALGRMDRRQDQVVLVEQRRTGQVAGGGGGIEGQLGQQPRAARESPGQALELLEIAEPGVRALVPPGEHGLQEPPEAFDLDRSGGVVPGAVGQRLSERLDLADGGGPVLALEESREGGSAGVRRGVAAEAQSGHLPTGRDRPHALGQLQDPEPAHLVERVLQDAEQREDVLHVRGLHELQAAVLDERDVPAGQLDLQEVAVVAGAEQHGLAAEWHAPFAMLQDPAAHLVALLGLVAAGHQD